MARMRQSGGYRQLKSFRLATVIYDGTWWFCERFLPERSRMSDQMVQAARSGRQNIAEGSRAAATSSQTELRLVNVARASLEELLLDFEDFLRHRHLEQWPVDSEASRAVREIRADDYQDDRQHYGAYARWLSSDDPALRANALICLIHQANYLLDRQIDALEAEFVSEGGYSEQLAKARLAERERQRMNRDHAEQPTPIPPCPLCGKPTVLRTAQKGPNAGQNFWGCTGYPECKGIVKI